MPQNYLVQSFTKGFIDNLIQMSVDGHLKFFNETPGRIVFPFCAHFFHILNAAKDLEKQFKLTYLTASEVTRESHKLSYATTSHKSEILQTTFFEEQERYITSSRKALLNYSSGLLLTKKEVEYILDEIGNVSEIRYIVLSQK